MKKLYSLVAGLVLAGSLHAQVDTLTSHFVGNPALYVPDAVMPLDSGWISGSNAYGDLAKMQLFDAEYGVTDGGTITGVLLSVPVKIDAGGSFQVAIWGDNAGQPANPMSPLAFANVTLASVDTAVAAFDVANNAVFYNVAVNFAVPATIPANHKFWAGIVLPTTAGNAMALFSTNLQTNPFADAATHTGEFWNDASFHTFGDPQNWNAPVALGIFPVVDLVAGINENVIEAAVYPNPANDVLNLKASEEIASVSVITMDGKVVATANASSIDVSGINAGMYMYEAVTVTGKVARGNFAKN